MNLRHWIWVGFAAAGFPLRASACPACNMHNYLGESIRSSRNVLIGKVLERPGTGDVRVEVVAVLRGEQKPGEQVDMKRQGALQPGKCYIFSDPDSFGVTYPSLPLSYKEEVEFLLEFGPDMVCTPDGQPRPVSGKPVARDLEHAIRLVQGISNEARTLGGEYLASVPRLPASHLIKEIRKQRQAVDSTYATACLVDALMLKPSVEADRFALDELQRLLIPGNKVVDWDKVPLTASADGEYMRVLLGCPSPSFKPTLLGSRGEPKRLANPALRKKLRELAVEALPVLDAPTAADVTYALCSTRSATIEELKSAMAGKNRDPIALGLYFFGNREAYVWSRATAKEAYTRAMAVAGEPRLRAAIVDSDSKLPSFESSLADVQAAAEYFERAEELGCPGFADAGSPETGPILTAGAVIGFCATLAIVLMRKVRRRRSPAAEVR